MNKTAFIVVDMLNDFLEENGKVFYPKYRKIIPDVKYALELSRRYDKLIIFMKHSYRKDKYDKNLLNMRECLIEGTTGSKIIKELETKPTDYIINKRRYSSFFATDLDLVLKENSIENVVLVGIKTDNCIFSSALDAYYLNYNVFVIEDAVATKDDNVGLVFLETINKYIGKTITLIEYKNMLSFGEL